jgi:hypothetical protein
MRLSWLLSAAMALLGGHLVAQSSDVIPCAVTLPNAPDQVFENPQLAVSVWREGTVVFKPGGPGFVLSDGALSMKFGWQRRVHGALTITGRRLDATASPLRANIPSGYGDIGFQATALIFPTPGWWEVTGKAGAASLSFITRVVKVGDGPV